MTLVVRTLSGGSPLACYRRVDVQDDAVVGTAPEEFVVGLGLQRLHRLVHPGAWDAHPAALSRSPRRPPPWPGRA